MAEPIHIDVATEDEGLELLESLVRRGLPGALLPGPYGWEVEVVSRRDTDGVLQYDVAVALERWVEAGRQESLHVRVGERPYDLPGRAA